MTGGWFWNGEWQGDDSEADHDLEDGEDDAFPDPTEAPALPDDE